MSAFLPSIETQIEDLFRSVGCTAERHPTGGWIVTRKDGLAAMLHQREIIMGHDAIGAWVAAFLDRPAVLA